MGAGESCDVRNFYPRSPCGERHEQAPCITGGTQFLSTLSLRRATRLPTALRTPHHNFYPRSPCGERLTEAQSLADTTVISIHALLAESDIVHALKLAHTMLFLSTLSLRRATTERPVESRSNILFLSTLSLRRATARRESRQQPAGISIHALLAESDPGKSNKLAGQN